MWGKKTEQTPQRLKNLKSLHILSADGVSGVNFYSEVTLVSLIPKPETPRL